MSGLTGYMVIPHEGTCSLCGRKGEMWPITRGYPKPLTCKDHPRLPDSSRCPACKAQFNSLFGSKCVNGPCNPAGLDRWLHHRSPIVNQNR